MTGWYRMHRGWMDHTVFRGEAFSKRDAFQWMIQEAAFKPVQVRTLEGIIDLERGQFSHSLRYMAKAWKWTEPRVRRFLKATQDAKIIDAATVAGQTVITICNYDRYQVTPDRADAETDAGATQPRSVGDAKIKNEKKEEEERGAGAPSAGSKGHAFAGATIRLNRNHFDSWAALYHAIPDLSAELATIDGWWQRQPPADRQDWFLRTSNMLNRKHQELLAKRPAEVKSELQQVFDNADAADRRYRRFLASQQTQGNA